MLRSGVAALAACAALISAACSPQADPAEPPEASASAKKAFGVTLHAPSDWHVASDEEFRQMRKVAEDVIAADDSDLRRMADASQKARTVIFLAFRYKPDATVDYNPSVYASAASVAQAPDGMTVRRYLRDAITAARVLGPAMVIDGDFRTREIDGEMFDWVRIHLDANGLVVTQDHYAARHGDDVINIIQSYADEAQRLETDKVVSAIELDW